MSWIKKGKLLEINNNSEWMNAYATLPVFYPVDENIFRIYFSTRDKQGKSYPAYAVYDRHTWELMELSANPILEWGGVGSFDENGIMCSSLIKSDNKVYMYYIGWNQKVTVHYQVSIGLAISNDGGKTFEKYSAGPIMDRDIWDPIFCTTPFVLKEGSLWKMWYSSCTEWSVGNKKIEPFYNIRYAESSDGIIWRKDSKEPCIRYETGMEAITRPWVIKEANLYKMWYSYRRGYKYRENKEEAYRIGYAESEDGVLWQRKDDRAGINTSESGWDSQMICYNSVFEEKGEKYMLYNGNMFGKTGFGIAQLLKDSFDGEEVKE